MEFTSQQIKAEISKYKVKQGHLFKRYGFFNNQWRQRWIVLTQNYLISFQHKQTYSKQCQMLPIEDIQTLKSYFKRQQERDLSFRAQSKKQNFYLSARTNQDKWAWIGAIERVIDRKQTRVFNPKAKETDPLAGTMQVNTALQKLYQKGIKRMSKQNTTTKPKQKTTANSQQGKNKKIQNKIEIVNSKKEIIQSKQLESSEEVNASKQISQISLKGQNNQTTKQIQINNTLKPEEVSLKQTENQVIQKQKQFIHNFEQKDGVINKLFQDILSHQRDMKFLVDFISNLALDQKLQYTDSIVEACISHPKARYFIQSLVKVFSLETEQHPMNVQLLFMILIHQYDGNYFYVNDLKVLLDNLIRGLELYKSELNHSYILKLVQSLITVENWQKIPQNCRKQLKELISQVQKTSPSQTNRNLSKQILKCM